MRDVPREALSAGPSCQCFAHYTLFSFHSVFILATSIKGNNIVWIFHLSYLVVKYPDAISRPPIDISVHGHIQEGDLSPGLTRKEQNSI